MEISLGKIEINRNWCWYCEEILESFSEIISVKIGGKQRRNPSKRFSKKNHDFVLNPSYPVLLCILVLKSLPLTLS